MYGYRRVVSIAALLGVFSIPLTAFLEADLLFPLSGHLSAIVGHSREILRGGDLIATPINFVKGKKREVFL